MKQLRALLLTSLIWPGYAMAAAGIISHEIHLTNAQDGDIRVVMRIPLYMIYADQLEKLPAGATPEIPFLVPSTVDGSLQWLLDVEQIFDDYESFGAFILKNYRFTANDSVLQLEWPETGIINLGPTPDFETGLFGSEALISMCTVPQPGMKIEDVTVMMTAYLSDIAKGTPLKIETLAPSFHLHSNAKFEMRLADHRTTMPEITLFDGLWVPSDK